MSHQRNTPKNWPIHIQYTQSQSYHSSVSSAILSFVEGTVANSPTKADQRENLRSSFIIQPISEPSHPVCGQYGLFATRKIAARVHIVDYIGEVHCDDRPDSDYDMSLYRFHDGTSVGSDASRMGNEARFVNDYRGIRTKPNAEFRDGRSVSGELRMSIWSLSESIKKGDEIVVSYGKAWWNARMTRD